ncbi:MAG: holo-ACP synthase [Sulfuricella sp.]|nr:holo-ACP synthase [Sulfuricella sp.]
MIFGIGTDIVAVSRMAGALERHGERFAARLLAPEERAEFALQKSPARFLAKRFAAKEAFAKALGSGVRHPATLHNIRVGHDSLGKPLLAFHPDLADELAQRGIRAHHLSLSDEQEMAVAFVILES